MAAWLRLPERLRKCRRRYARGLKPGRDIPPVFRTHMWMIGCSQRDLFYLNSSRLEVTMGGC